MNKAESAKAAMAAGTTNCAQSVIDAFAEELGLDRDTALKLALGFGGGMGHTDGRCGAVTAAYMVLGLKQEFDSQYPKKYRDQLYALVDEFNKRFIKTNGSIDCTKLLGYDLSNPESAAAFRNTDIGKKLCPQFVYEAVKIVEGMKE